MTTNRFGARKLGWATAVVIAGITVLGVEVANATITMNAAIDGTTADDLVAGGIDADYQFDFQTDVSDASTRYITVRFPDGYEIADTATVQDAVGNPGSVSIGGTDDQAVTVDTVVVNREVFLDVGAQDLAGQAIEFRITSGVTNPEAAGETGEFGVLFGTMPAAGDVDFDTSVGTVAITAGEATGLKLSGTATQAAGDINDLTITAVDQFGNTDTAYDGAKELTFGGAGTAPDGTVPTVTESDGTLVDFGSPTTISFSAGVASVTGSSNGQMTLYDAETAAITATDGAVDTATDQGTPLSVTVDPAAASVLSVTGEPGETTAGNAIAGPPTVTVTDAFGNPVAGADVSVAAFDSGDSEYTFDFGGGPVTSDAAGAAAFTGLGILAADTGYTLVFSSTAGDLTTPGDDVTSTTFDVVAADADHLVFRTQPVDTLAGENLVPVVEIRDVFGNVAVDDDRTITLSIGFDPSGGDATLGGDVDLTTTAGVAAWTGGEGLNIDEVAVGYTLQAEADGAPLGSGVNTVQSDPFDIQLGPEIQSTALGHDADGDGTWDAVDDVLMVNWRANATHISGDGALSEAEVEALLGPDIDASGATILLDGSGTANWTLTISGADLAAGIDLGDTTVGTDNADVTGDDANPQVPGTDVTLQGGMWPECGGTVGPITVNSRCIEVNGFQRSTDGGANWSSIDPTDGGLDLDVFHTGLLQIQVVDDDRLFGGPPDQYELVAAGGKLDASDQIRIELNVGNLDPVVLIGTGVLHDYTTTPNGDTIVEIVAEPGNASWLFQGCDLADFGGCGDDQTVADVDYTGLLSLAIAELEFDAALQDAARGTTIMTDAQTFAAPDWDAASGSFVVDLAAPHLLTDGTTANTGEFTAFLPDGMFTDEFFGVTPEDAEFNATADGSVITASATVVAGGVELELSGFSYSAPEIAITASAPASDPGSGSGDASPPPGAETVTEGVDSGGTVSTDPDGDGVSEEKPVQVALTTPVSGIVSITTQPPTGQQDGFQLVGTELDISAPDATPEEPLVLSLTVHAPAVSDGSFVGVFRDGVLVPPCATPEATTASPDPCVASTGSSAGDLVLTVLTSKASVWNLGALELGSIGFVCPTDSTPAADFGDVADGHAHGPAIDCVVANGIAGGTIDGAYSPGDVVTRAQMATFLVNLLEAAGVTLPDGSATFIDVAGTHADSIERLAAAGIVSGRTATRYDPNGDVNREQMATFLVRAFEHVTGRALSESETAFTDLSGPHADNVRKLVGIGVTLGVSDTEYGPQLDVRRGQMASFLGRTLNRLAVEGFSKN